MTAGRNPVPIPSAKTALWRAADRPDYAGPLLLDTHMWVWMLAGNTDRISPEIVAIMTRAAAESTLAVSDISFWEVALKTAKGKLVLSMDASIWLSRAERAPGVEYVPLDRTILLQSTRLPGAVQGDPADRMLIATAQLRSMPLATVDDAIIAYAASEPAIPVCDARP